MPLFRVLMRLWDTMKRYPVKSVFIIGMMALGTYVYFESTGVLDRHHSRY